MARSFFLAIYVGLSALLTHCSPHFNNDWHKAANHLPKPLTDLSGAWQGTWKSLSSGHHGKLRAIATPLPEDNTEGTTYEFRYHATWAKILSGGYTAKHTVKQTGRHYTISGQHDLGKLFGGVYHYSGTATPTSFQATYECSLDKGVFELLRPAVE